MLEEICRSNLLELARVYARAMKLTLEQVSARCYGKRSFLNDFRRGEQSASLKTYVTSILKNRVRDMLRKAAMRQKYEW